MKFSTTLLCAATVANVASGNVLEEGIEFMSSLTSWETHPVNKKMEGLKVAARSMGANDYGVFFAGFFTVGGTDVMKNFGHVWPCVGDVANIAEAGYDTYKYMDRYVKTDNSFMIINAFSRGMSGL